MVDPPCMFNDDTASPSPYIDLLKRPNWAFNSEEPATPSHAPNVHVKGPFKIQSLPTTWGWTPSRNRSQSIVYDADLIPWLLRNLEDALKDLSPPTSDSINACVLAWRKTALSGSREESGAPLTSNPERLAALCAAAYVIVEDILIQHAFPLCSLGETSGTAHTHNDELDPDPESNLHVKRAKSSADSNSFTMPQNGACSKQVNFNVNALGDEFAGVYFDQIV